MWLSWSNIAAVLHFTYKLRYQFKLGTVSSFCNRFWEEMSLVIYRDKNHSFQITTPYPPATSSFGDLLWLISEPTLKCNILNIPIDMETIAWRAAETHRTFYGEISIPASMEMAGFSTPDRKKHSIQILNCRYQHKRLLPPCVSILIYGVSLIVVDLVKPKMPPTLSFSGIHWNPFIYCMNRTNSQLRAKIYFSIWSL